MTKILTEPTGTEYYNGQGCTSLNTLIKGVDSTVELQELIGKHDSQAKLNRIKQYILAIPQYKYFTHQRQVIELIVEGYTLTDISDKLTLKKSYVSSCIVNFRKHAKKYLTVLQEGGIM